MYKFLIGLIFSLAFINSAQAQSIPCSGITLKPTDVSSIASTVNSQPQGTTFCFEPGTYNLTNSIEMNNGNKFICKTPRACIIDGGNTVPIGLITSYAATQDQLIYGFTVQRFTQFCLKIRDRGRAENNDLHDCDEGMTLNGAAVNNYIHHNRRYGIGGGPAKNILIEGNEIAFNNTSHFDPGNDAGGTKIVGSQAGATVTWRNNKVHDNYGVGIWNDGNVYSLIEGNTVYNNFSAGIFHEISWAATIRNNLVYENNLVNKNLNKSCWWGAQISLNNSQNVDIYGNTIIGEGVNGICLENSIRSERAPFPQALGNVAVHNNIIKMRGAVKSGFTGDRQPTNIRFYSNTYYINSSTGVFWHNMSKVMTKNQWQASGQDQAGTFFLW